MLECPQRSKAGDKSVCNLISGRVGWRCVVSQKTCEECLAATPEVAALVRERAASRVIEGAKRSFKSQEPTVSRILAERHMGAEGLSLLADIEIDPYRTPKSGWARVKQTWQDAQDFVAAMKSRGLDDKKVELTVKGVRHDSCFGEPCPSLRLSDDGVHHYCGACGCGDSSLALLDSDGYSKLDYPELKCPRRRPGFVNSLDPRIYSMFDRVVCINLDRRKDRWASFSDRVKKVEWPFPPIKRFAAVDGKLLPPPTNWRSGQGAWGCMQSHRQVLERAIQDGVNSLLILEDDAFFVEDFERRAIDFLLRVPEDWEGLMLGGQHVGQPRVTPIKVSDGVVRCVNAQRTHAYAVRGNYMKDLYQELCSKLGHADHVMGPFAGKRRVYAPEVWLIGQGETKSDISGRNDKARLWEPPTPDDPFAVVMGDKSGLTGYHFGYHLGPDGVDIGLRRIVDRQGPHDQFVREAKRWIELITWEAAAMPETIGAFWCPDCSPKRLAAIRELLGGRLKEVRVG